MTDDLAKPPRFPYIAAFLCATCLGAAAWTWMRYSYCWDMPCGNRHFGEAVVFLREEGAAADLQQHHQARRWPDGAYAHVRGRLLARSRERASLSTLPRKGPEVAYQGRLVEAENWGYRWCVLTTASRFHGASIAGLVVGAMGVFVFAVALRYWLRERRRFLEKDEGA